jgi:folate-binding Fe-S cluster repair protein YgfZ
MSEEMGDGSTSALTWSTVAARGEETTSFLQGQLSQDLTQVGDRGAWSLLLAPDSVVLSTCYVRPVEGGFDLVVPAALAEATLNRLKRFLLRTACTLAVYDEAAGPFTTLEQQIDARWPGAREFAAGLTPHSFGQAFVKSTISFDKGCFTGQELVGRLDARGASVPWRLVYVQGASLDSLNEVLRAKGPAGPQGVTSWYERDGTVFGLGFAHRSLFATREALTDGVVIEEVD